MNNKVKLLILFLIGTLGFLGLKGWTYLKKTYLATSADVVFSSTAENLVIDTDGDGLSDIEESFHRTDFRVADTDGDGYLDGEEVISGYNPRIAAPDDVRAGTVSKRAADTNLTKRISGRLLASTYNGEVGYDSSIENLEDALEGIALNTYLESKPIFFVPSENEINLLIANTFTLEDERAYIRDIFEVIEVGIVANMFPPEGEFESLAQAIGEDPDLINRIVDSKLDTINRELNRMQVLSVPKPWKEIHISIIDLLNRRKTAHLILKSSVSDNDPIKAIMALQEIFNLNDYIIESGFLPEIVQFVLDRGVGIDTDNSLILIMEKMGYIKIL